MSGPYFTEACVRNKRKDKDLERELEEIDRKRDLSLKNIHIQTVDLMQQKDQLRYAVRKLDNYDIAMHPDDLTLYNNERNARIKERKRSKMDPYSNLRVEPVDKMRVPKSLFADANGRVIEVGSCNGQLLKTKKWMMKCSDDFRCRHTTSGDYYQLKRMLDDD